VRGSPVVTSITDNSYKRFHYSVMNHGRTDMLKRKPLGAASAPHHAATVEVREANLALHLANESQRLLQRRPPPPLKDAADG
jgi:hypothetical protein